MMSGYAYGDHEPTKNCPYCDTVCCADFVDIGVGYQQCGPYHCENCFASEIGPYDEERPLSDIEQKYGWYAPHSKPGSTANVIEGRIVRYNQARDAYRQEFEGNLLYHVEGYVEDWWKSQR